MPTPAASMDSRPISNRDYDGEWLRDMYEKGASPGLREEDMQEFLRLTGERFSHDRIDNASVYMLLAVRTLAPKVRESFKDSLLNAGVGIASEGGEINEILKKHFFHGHPMDVEMVVHLQKETGDLLWYVMLLCYAMRMDPAAVMATNIKKLEARYPEGVLTTDRSLNRKKGDI